MHVDTGRRYHAARGAARLYVAASSNGAYFDELTSEQTRFLFKKFAKKWNAGKVAGEHCAEALSASSAWPMVALRRCSHCSQTV
jgi:hypothetical protein